MTSVETQYEVYQTTFLLEPVKLNPSVINFVTLDDVHTVTLADLKNEYLNIKWQVTWDELLQEVNAGKKNPRGKENKKYIRMLIFNKGSATNVKTDFIKKAFKVSTASELYKTIHNYTIENQRDTLNKLKPNNLSEAINIFVAREGSDPTGLNTVVPLIERCKNTLELVSELFSIINQHITLLNLNNGRIKDTNLRNYLELLAILHRKNVFLYPFVCKSSDNSLHKFLLHKNNVCYYFHEKFADRDACEFVKMVQNTGITSSLAKMISDARCLTMATTFRKCNQLSDSLLNKIIEINENVTENKSNRVDRNNSSRYTVFANLLIGIHNAEQINLNFKIKPRQKNKKHRLSYEDYCDFSFITENKPQLSWWSLALKNYCLSTRDSQYTSRVSACKAFVAWLLKVNNPPEKASDVVRAIHINDYFDGNTFRHHLKNNYSLGSINTHLTLMRQFFDFAHDLMLQEYASNPNLLKNYTNPIDPKFDSFNTTVNIGTKRVPIEAKIMEMMRGVLVENDYEFPRKNFTFCYAPLTNHKTNKYEPNVFCPSITNLLYFMLWIPLRKIQAQLLDSGEGDKYIYDFESKAMIRNRHLFASNENRSEGVIQLVPSGIIGIDDIVGLYITTNKSSKDGYDIPWVCEELLDSLKNQFEWLSQYSPLPELRGRESLGKMVGENLEKYGKKFYPLFRDPTAEKKDDPYAPAAGHRIKYAWGLLCQEVEKRINNKSKGFDGEIRLTVDKKGLYPTSRYDIHTLRVSGITDLLEKGVPLGIVQKFVAGHATFMMTLWYDNPPYFKVREYLENARKNISSSNNFSLRNHNLNDVKKFFVVNEAYLSGSYTPYDVLEKNSGIVSIKLSGICPGASCEEGGFDQYRDRFAPVPVGDRGPSCPQCRFWITGPMFLLGQVIEGNQLIRKIKTKINAVDKIRESILNAEDNEDVNLITVLSGREEREMRILSNMVTEWYERMKFYEASTSKLDDWIKYKEVVGSSENEIALLTKSTKDEIKYNFQERSELELTHFISTAAEFFPEFIDSDDTSVPDLEQTISKFTAINDISSLYFKLSDQQRLVATNMITGVLIDSFGANKATELLEGNITLSTYPEISNQIKKMLEASQEKAFVLNKIQTDSV